LKKEWDPTLPFEQQPRYAASTNCKLYEIFQGLNDWKIITLVDTEESYLEANDEVHELVLAGIAITLSRSVAIGGYGAVMTDDPKSDGYYVLQWESEPRILEEGIDVDGVFIAKGELVLDGIYLNKVPRAKQWYTKAPSDDEESLRTLVQMKHVVLANLNLTGESQNQKLPRNCDRTTARQLGTLRVSDGEHDLISDEISRRDRLEFLDVVDEGKSSSSDLESEGDSE
jgi:hypothetical protein